MLATSVTTIHSRGMHRHNTAYFERQIPPERTGVSIKEIDAARQGVIRDIRQQIEETGNGIDVDPLIIDKALQLEGDLTERIVNSALDPSRPTLSHRSYDHVGPSDSEDWQERAACIGHDPDFFINDYNRFKVGKAVTAMAVTICRRCPVIDECLDYALLLDSGGAKTQTFGVWGGMTEKERKAMLNRKKRDTSI